MKKILLILFSLFYTLTGWTHPHAFIEMKNRVLVKDNQLQGFAMQWTLDDISASAVLYDLKQAKSNGKAVQTLIDEMMANIVNEHFFSYIYDTKGTKIKYKAFVYNYGINTENNKLTYYFDFLLSHPQPLKNNRFSLFTYDPSYYIDMGYNNKKDIDFSALPHNCQGKLVEPNVDEKMKNYASSLDKNAINTDQTLGKVFAEEVEITCQ